MAKRLDKMYRSYSRIFVAIVTTGLLHFSSYCEVSAQVRPPDSTETPATSFEKDPLDIRLLRTVYRIDSPIFNRYMFMVDASAKPAFTGAVPAAWISTVLTDRAFDRAAAYRLTVSEIGGVLSMFVLKRVFRRPRPYMTVPGIKSRAGSGWLRLQEIRDPFAMPSGHTTVAFALASSIVLSYPRWYTVVPGVAWASSVALSRIWLGVHYPSDVLAGVLLGVAIGGAIHLLRDRITPRSLQSSDDTTSTAGPAVHLRFVF